MMQTILDNIEFLVERYSMERRATTQPYTLHTVQATFDDYRYKPGDYVVRESLMEHVGCLPIIATALYPHINDDEVNLGDALIMLAIHDIGELVTGDENTFTKKTVSNAEMEAGLRLLHPVYHPAYIDVETKKSKSAKFAKSIDKIAPDILDYLTNPQITISRYKHFVGIEADKIIETIVAAKRPYMLWNPFLTQFHTYLISKLQERLS